MQLTAGSGRRLRVEGLGAGQKSACPTPGRAAARRKGTELAEVPPFQLIFLRFPPGLQLCETSP